VALSWICRLLKTKSGPGSRAGRKKLWQNRFVPNLEALGDRTVPTVAAIHQGTLLVVTGDALDNTITISRDAAGTIFVNNGQVPIVGATPTVANTTTILVNGGSGDDTILLDETNGILPQARVLGGAGNDDITGGSRADILSGQQGDDTLVGMAGSDVLSGGDGNDFLAGGTGDDRLNGEAGNDFLIGGDGTDVVSGDQGDDVLLGGAGNDIFPWGPGDGNDVVEGQAGFDALQFDGSDDGEQIDLAANGGRLRVTRDVDNVTQDVNGIERVNVSPVGGADTVTVNDLSGTDVTEVNIDLPALDGGGDDQVDTVIVNGTNGNDSIRVAQDNVAGDARTTVLGLSAQVNITNAEAANDRLTVNALNGNDRLDASGLSAGAIQFTADGGNGDDTLIGTSGNDSLLGGNGDDVLIGGGGVDVVEGGRGDNIIIP